MSAPRWMIPDPPVHPVNEPSVLPVYVITCASPTGSAIQNVPVIGKLTVPSATSMVPCGNDDPTMLIATDVRPLPQLPSKPMSQNSIPRLPSTRTRRHGADD